VEGILNNSVYSDMFKYFDIDILGTSF